MPGWIRTVFLHYLPAALLMRRPRKTRLRWMMEMPGMGAPPHAAAAAHDLPKHIRYFHLTFFVKVYISNYPLLGSTKAC